jgi:hypothetical protein
MPINVQLTPSASLTLSQRVVFPDAVPPQIPTRITGFIKMAEEVKASDATALKDQGNDFFKEGKFAQALAAYT